MGVSRLKMAHTGYNPTKNTIGPKATKPSDIANATFLCACSFPSTIETSSDVHTRIQGRSVRVISPASINETLNQVYLQSVEHQLETVISDTRYMSYILLAGTVRSGLKAYLHTYPHATKKINLQRNLYASFHMMRNPLVLPRAHCGSR